MVNFLEHQAVQVADFPLAQRLGLAHHVLDIVDRITVIDRLEVFAQQLTADRDPLQHYLGFKQCQRVAFDRVGMVGPVQHQLVAQIAHSLGRQWPQGVQLPFQRIDFLESHVASMRRYYTP